MTIDAWRGRRSVLTVRKQYGAVLVRTGTYSSGCIHAYGVRTYHTYLPVQPVTGPMFTVRTRTRYEYCTVLSYYSSV